MSTIEKLYTLALGLVALYLLLSNPDAVNKIITSIGGFNIGTFGVLQGRTVSGGAFSVSGSGKVGG